MIQVSAPSSHSELSGQTNCLAAMIKRDVTEHASLGPHIGKTPQRLAIHQQLLHGTAVQRKAGHISRQRLTIHRGNSFGQLQVPTNAIPLSLRVGTQLTWRIRQVNRSLHRFAGAQPLDSSEPSGLESEPYGPFAQCIFQ